MTGLHINLDREAVSSFCRRWKIVELAFFGSVLRDDFGPDSDVDVLVTFSPDAGWSLLDVVRMEEDLGALVARKVDIVTRTSIESSDNWIRRRAILGSAQVVYAA